MRISPRFLASDWLALDASRDQHWKRALEILDDRIEGRFLRPIRSILPDKWSGFAVLALDALLVETLQQFWEGVDRTPSRVSANGCRQLQSEAYFDAFLRGPLFNGGFTKKTASLFYATVRCSILHQAEVSGSTRVRRNPPLVSMNADGRGLHINPEAFHQEIEKAFQRYITLLRDPSEVARRDRFWRKMNFIAQKAVSAVDGG